MVLKPFVFVVRYCVIVMSLPSLPPDVESLAHSLPSLPSDIHSLTVHDADVGFLPASISSKDLTDPSDHSDGLPSSVHNEDRESDDKPNGFDDYHLEQSEDEVSQPTGDKATPTADRDTVMALPHQCIAEYYSVPRVLPIAREKGLCGSLSLDLGTGWDFRHRDHKKLSLDALTSLPIQKVILSPPCAMFSDLQRLFNMKTRHEHYEVKLAESEP